MSAHNVIAVSFEDRSKAYEALSELKGAALEGRVECSPRRSSPVTNTVASAAPREATSGWGCHRGRKPDRALARRHRRPDRDAVRVDRRPACWWGVRHLSCGPAPTACWERSAATSPWAARPSSRRSMDGAAVEVVDKLMSEQGGTVYRRSAEVVLAEIEAAEDAYLRAQKEADRAMHEQRKAERRQHAQERMAALKEKLDVS